MDKQLLNRTTQQLKQVCADSTTPAGEGQKAANTEQKSALNQMFELFRFNYHNQFLKAFPDAATLITAKRLWSRLLVDYPASTILAAAERAVKESSYLPNVHEVISRCDLAGELGVPDAHAAYIEACRAPSPKKTFAWSHPVVYFAGRASDWFFLANNAEYKAFPVFKRNYDLLLQRLQQGEDIQLTIEKALPETSERPLARQQQQEKLQQLKSLL
ncbi:MULTISPECIES: replication protein P [unclassified Oceanobacter]|jgi:hypothetical protein|uniref:replication protein P n=1 Tax=unclassified Oceanobacter TaxID=2620260 RepID=UPI0026E34B52|nr:MULTISPECIES: replication protein P [unclassified Oceanobacter]MDO6681947.1 replication protein P [Oceanobacter sp. 5_MG-2023]MDP2609860.1 replication protein P [Oceanobacter sp. 1_MG-2023]MDP2612262.1 replication protein P [Oceanobacter sp. 2_MG-2023]